MKKKATPLTFCILLISFAASAQTQDRIASADTPSVASDTKVHLQRKIALDNESKFQEVTLEIEDEVTRLELNISSSITAGKLKIEIYDPKGNSYGTFSVGRQLTKDKSERVNGKIKKLLTDPQAGNWKVSIAPTEATGEIVIQTAFFY